MCRGKLILVIFNLFFFVLIVSASNIDSILKHTNINFYNDKINRTLCFEKIGRINSTFFEGVSLIGVYKPRLFSNGNVAVYLWKSQQIRLYRGCNIPDLVHELAHHKNKMDGVSFDVSIKGHNSYFAPFSYTQEFKNAEDDIWNN